MKNKLKGLYILTLFVLVLCTLMAVVLPTVASPDEDVLNHGISGVKYTRDIRGDALYTSVFGVAPQKTVADYLYSEEKYALRYHDEIPVDMIALEYQSSWGELTVTVPAYHYTAVNGVTVSWIPTHVTRGDASVSFASVGENYVAVLENLFHTEDFDITVHFTWQAHMTAEMISTLLQDPWAEGNDALEQIKVYETQQLHPYQEALLKYETYQAFLNAAADREQYLEDLALFEENLALYNAYVAEYQAYSAQLQAHEAWNQYRVDVEHYKEYQNFLLNDLKQYEAYMIYRDQVDQVNERLRILESTFTADSHNWRLYSSLMGSTVDTVLARKDDLIAGGCDAATIDKAGDATVKLRKLMKGYYDLHAAKYASDHERTKTLYAYYSANYISLRDEYRRLYEALFDLGNNSLVSAMLIKQGKIDHYIQFVGQLYVTYSALDDGHIRFADWSFRNHSLTQAVEELQRISDRGDADPKHAAMPAEEVPVVEKVEPIERPTVPSFSDPGHPGKAPAVVAEPVEPAYVPEPDLNNPPPAASHPGAMPAPPAIPQPLWSLAEAIRAGEVTDPSGASVPQGHTLELHTQVSCPVSIENKKTVRFYDLDRTTVLYEEKVDYGGSVTYLGPDMKKNDPYHEYTFLGWVNSEGGDANYHYVTSNLFIYANYRVVTKQYTITWILDGITQTTHVPYGTMPVSPFSLTRPDSQSHSFTFSGWDHDPVPVTGDATYVGSFAAEPHAYTVTWVTKTGNVKETVYWGSALSYPKDLPTSVLEGQYYHTFLSWDVPENTKITGNMTINARYSADLAAVLSNGTILTPALSSTTLTLEAGKYDVTLANVLRYAKETDRSLIVKWDALSITLRPDQMTSMLASGCARITLQSEKMRNGSIVYSLFYRDAAGNALEIMPTATVAPVSVGTDGIKRQYFFADDTPVPARTDVKGAFTLTAYEGKEITVVENPLCATGSIAGLGVPGKTVVVDPLCDYGYAVSGLKLTYPDGHVEHIAGNTFVMPDSTLTLEVVVEKIMYIVNFYVNGQLYHTAAYALGEKIQAPASPEGYSDDTYAYTFLRWDPLPTLAMGEELVREHHAVFSQNMLRGADDYRQSVNNNRLLTIYLPIALAVIAVGVVLLVWFRRKKKRAAAKAATVEEATQEDEITLSVMAEISVEETFNVPLEDEKTEDSDKEGTLVSDDADNDPPTA